MLRYVPIIILNIDIFIQYRDTNIGFWVYQYTSVGSVVKGCYYHFINLKKRSKLRSTENIHRGRRKTSRIIQKSF